MARTSKMKKLFLDLYKAHTEEDVEIVLARHHDLVGDERNWRPVGGEENNYAIIQNQQGQPVAALVEKLTNAIDAVLMRRCLEEDIDPESDAAPRDMEAAIQQFFPDLAWQDKARYDRHALDIQLLADGPRKKSSLTIYDDGEGQEPDDFPDTFLSLIRGNKKNIPFVQGLYNMGGTGAMVFCGENKYQLIGSRRYHGKGDFGFTLIRRHTLSTTEETSKRALWYEYLCVVGDEVPRFAMSSPMDLGLRKRRFETGTVVKLYSYQLPTGFLTNIAQDLYQSVSELLIEPALPIWVADRKHRYPKTVVLERALRGLRRTLAQESDKLVDRHLEFHDHETDFGLISVDCYVFKAATGKKSVKEARDSLRKRFFKNGGSVLLAVNGQVHGAWGTEFISRGLEMQLLKDHVLVLVDCTRIKTAFRNDLFMASRDRMPNTVQSRHVRDVLKSLLGTSELREIYEARKRSLGVDAGEATKAIKQYVKALSLKPELQKLLAGQLDLDEISSLLGGGDNDAGRKKAKDPRTDQEKRDAEDKRTFQGKKFPTFFHLARPTGAQESTPAARIPRSGTRSVRFYTDAEDQYFRRTDAPGELELALFSHRNVDEAGDKRRKKKRSPRSYELSDLFHVERSEPESGELMIRLTPKEEARVGDSVQIHARLFDERTDHNEWFWVRVVADKKKTKGKSGDKDKGALPGLPDAILVGRERKKGSDVQRTWDDLDLPIDEEVVVLPIMSGDRIEQIIINMDSKVMANYRAERPNMSEEQLRVLDNQYIAVMYLHTLLMGGGMATRGYNMTRPDPDQIGTPQDVDIAEFIAGLFADGYADFLLRFESSTMLDLMAE